MSKRAFLTDSGRKYLLSLLPADVSKVLNNYKPDKNLIRLESQIRTKPDLIDAIRKASENRVITYRALGAVIGATGYTINKIALSMNIMRNPITGVSILTPKERRAQITSMNKFRAQIG